MRALFREGLFQISAWPQWHLSGITNFYVNRLNIHTLPAFSYSPNLDTSFFIVEEAKPEKYKWQFYFGLPNRKTRASVESRGVARWFKPTQHSRYRCAHSWSIFQHSKRTDFVSPRGHLISSMYVTSDDRGRKNSLFFQSIQCFTFFVFFGQRLQMFAHITFDI